MERASIGPYRIVRRLGAGGMGAVYLVEREGRSYALKVVLPSLADAETWLRFERESRVLRELDHPGVVRWVEAGRADGVPYVVMEAVEGGSLAEQIQRHGPLPIEQVLGLGIRLAEALEHAHARGVLHRDLKPANVLLAADGPRLSDFGLAALCDGPARLTRTGDVLGSPNYMAPEQAEGRHRDQGVHTDVYGLGGVLYHALTGQPPVAHPQMLELLRRVSQQAPTPPSRLRDEVPPGLERLVLDCLAKDPAARPASAAAVGQALARLRELHSERGGAAPRARTGAWVAALLVVLGLAAATWGTRAGGASIRASEATPDGTPVTAFRASEVPPDGTPVEAPTSPPPTPRPAASDAPGTADGLGELEQELRGWLDAGRFGDVEARARRELEQHPGSAMLWRAIAVAAIRRRQVEEALAAAARATDLGPDDSQAWTVRASIEVAVRQSESALRSADRALALDSREERAWVHRGTALMQLRRLDEAYEAYSRALALRVDGDPFVRANRATVLVNLGRFEEARADLERVLRALPDDRYAAWLYARTLSELGREPEAIEGLFELLARPQPAGEDAKLRQDASRLLTELLLEAGRREEARRVAAEALRREPGDARVWRLAALAADDLHEAERLLSRAIELAPRFGEAWRERGVLRIGLEHLEAALSDLDRAAPLVKDPTIYQERGLVHAELGQLESALEDFQRVIALQPAAGDAYLHAARICRRLGRLDDALPLVEDGVLRLPNRAPAHAERAEVLLGLGRRDEARASWERALELEPSSPLRDVWMERLAELSAR